MARDEDEVPRRRAHDIGQDLSLLSVEELEERIVLLREEITRLSEAAAKKRAGRDAAESVFKIGR